MATVSGEPRLVADTGDSGRLCVTGDLPGMSASGGLLAVRRVADDQWLTGSGLWSADRPQWFPFHCDEGTAGETCLEVRAATLLDLIATPPTGPLSARLRFVATAQHDALELDIDLTLPCAVATSQGDDLPSEASDAQTPVTGLTPGDGPTAEAEPPASVEPHDAVVPRDGATGSAGDLQIPPTTERQPDQSQRSRSDPAERASAAAVIGSRAADAADASPTDTATGTLPTIPTESQTDKVDIAPESRPGPLEPDDEADASKRNDNPAQAPDLSANAPVEARADPPVTRDPGPAIDANDLPLSVWPTGSAKPELEGETAQAPDAKSNDGPMTKQLYWQRVGVIATMLVLAAIAVTWWFSQSPKDGSILPPGPAPTPPRPAPTTPPRPLNDNATRKLLERYFPAQDGLDCARTPNHPDCRSPEDATIPPAADTTRQQLEDFFDKKLDAGRI
jgi:hypothetical protein